MPRADAQHVIEQIAAGPSVSADQLALRVGSSIVQGRDKAQAALDSFVRNDAAAPSGRAFRDDSVASSRPKSTGLLGTLEEIVGVRQAVGRSAGSLELADRTGAGHELDKELSANDESSPSAEKGSGAASADAASKGNDEPSRRAEPSLVSRKMEAARVRREQEKASTTGIPAAVADQRFITLVVEFGLPESQPASGEKPGALKNHVAH